jgi:hypothetical protein
MIIKSFIIMPHIIINISNPQYLNYKFKFNPKTVTIVHHNKQKCIKDKHKHEDIELSNGIINCLYWH